MNKKASLLAFEIIAFVLILGGLAMLSQLDTDSDAMTTYLIYNPHLIPSPLTWDEDTNYSINLSYYFASAEGNPIYFNNSPVNNISFIYQGRWRDISLQGYAINDIELFNSKLYFALNNSNISDSNGTTFNTTNTGLGNITDIYEYNSELWISGSSSSFKSYDGTNFTSYSDSFAYNSTFIEFDGELYLGNILGLFEFEDVSRSLAIENKTVGYWKLDEGGGGTVTDSSGSGNAGSKSGGTWLASGARFNGGIEFDGISSWVNVPNSSSLKISGNNMTLEAWIRPSSSLGAGNYGAIIAKLNHTENAGYGLFFGNNDKILFTIRNSGTTTNLYSNSTIPLNRWTHVVGIFNGAEMKIYINSEMDSNAARTAYIGVNDAHLGIGCMMNETVNKSDYFNGTIDEVAIYNISLDETQIREHCGRLCPVNQDKGVLALERYDSKMYAASDSNDLLVLEDNDSWTTINTFTSPISSSFETYNSELYFGLSNGSLMSYNSSAILNHGNISGTITDLELFDSKVYFSGTGGIYFHSTLSFGQIMQDTITSHGVESIKAWNSLLYTGSSDGEIDTYDANSGYSLKLVPDEDFNTDDLTEPIAVVINASDPTDDEWNQQGPIVLYVTGIDDNISVPGNASDGDVFANGTILDKDINEDSNYSINLTKYFYDPEGANLTFDFQACSTRPTGEDPCSSPLASKFNFTFDSSTGNATLVPRANWTGHEFLRFSATDGSSTAYSNWFLLNVLPGGDNLTKIANITQIILYEDSTTYIELSDYFYDPDNTTVYGYNSPPPNVTVTIEGNTGHTSLTPHPGFSGNNTINFTAVDLDPAVGISLSEIVTLVVFSHVNFNLSNPFTNISIVEDGNYTINLTDYFYAHPGVDMEYKLVYDDRLLLCHFDSSLVCSDNETPINSSGFAYADARFEKGIFIDGFLTYNATDNINVSNGTIEFWVKPKWNGTFTDVSENMTNITNMFVQVRTNGTENSTRLLDISRELSANTTYHSSVLKVNVMNDSGNLTGECTHNVSDWLASELHHLAVNFNSSFMEVFVDGILVCSNNTQSATAAGEINIGMGMIGNTTYYANATIDELRITNRFKDADEISRTYIHEYPLVQLSIDNTTKIGILYPDEGYYGMQDARFAALGSIAYGNMIIINVTSLNDPPTLNTTIPNQTWDEDSSKENAFNLDDHFSDPDNSTLIYSVDGANRTVLNSTSTKIGNITITIDNSTNNTNNVSFTSDGNWAGTATVRFNATDGINTTSSNNVTITVIDLPESPDIVVITPVGVQSETVDVSFIVSDQENDTVNITAMYSLDGGSTWSAATGPELAGLATTMLNDILSPAEDSYVDSANITTNFGNQTSIKAGTEGSRKVRSFVRFDLPDVNSRLIGSATLRVFQRISQGESRLIGLYTANESWTEENITWNSSMNSANWTAIDTQTVSTVLDYFEFNATQALLWWLNDTSILENDGFILKDVYEPGTTGLHIFSSSEYLGNETPQLEIEYNDAQYEFNWDSLTDIGPVNKVVQMMIIDSITGSNGSSMNFTVNNNNAPSVNTSGVSNFTLLEDEIMILNMSHYFYDVDGQVLSFNGTGLNLSFEVIADQEGPETTVFGDDSFQGEPDIAVDSQDNRYIVWQTRTAGNFDIAMQKYDKDNVVQTYTVLTTESSDQTQPKICIDDDTKYIVWSDKRNGDYDIYLAKLLANDSISFTKRITNTSNNDRNPVIECSSDNITIAWDRDGSSNIFYRLVDSEGNFTQNETILLNSSLEERKPVIAGDSSGNRYIVFESNETIIQMKILYANGTSSQIVNISDMGGYKADPAIAIDPHDKAYIAWAGNLTAGSLVNVTSIFYSKYNLTSKMSSGNISSSIERFKPDIKIDSDENKYIVYEYNVNQLTDILFTKLNKTDGRVYEDNVTVNTLAQVKPVAAVDSLDRKIVVWQHETGNDDIKMRELSENLPLLKVIPDAEYFGTTMMNITAWDGYNFTIFPNITITYLPVNDAPLLIAPLPDVTFKENTFNDSINLSNYFWDPDNVLTFTFVSNTSNVSLNFMSPIANFTSDIEWSGTGEFTITASDNESSVNDTLIVTVIKVDYPPTHNNPLIGAHEPSNSWLDNHVVGYWQFEDEAADETGMNDGTVYVAVHTDEGRVGRAYEFNKSEFDYIDIGDSPVFNITEKIAISAWVRTTNSGFWQDIVTKWNCTNGCVNTSWWVGIDTTNKALCMFTNSSKTNIMQAQSTTDLTDGNWHHIVCMYDGLESKVYVDGVKEGNQTGTMTMLASAEPVRIGVSGHIYGLPSNNHIVGMIDEVIIWNRSLSDQEIGDIYNSTGGFSKVKRNMDLGCSANNTNDLDMQPVKNIFNWYLNGTSIIGLNMPFEGNNGSESTVAQDYSIHENNGSVKNGTAWSKDIGYDGRGAYEFDGIDDFIIVQNHSSINFPSNSFTMTSWIRTDKSGPSYNGWIFDTKQAGHGTRSGYSFFIFNGQLMITLGNGTGFIQTPWSGSSYNVTDNEWHHVVGVVDYEENKIRTYVDGNLDLETSVTFSGDFSNDYNLYIGSYNEFTNSSYFFEGMMDEAMIINKSLSDEQIRALYEMQYSRIVEDETTEGDRWSCEIIPNDGEIAGSRLMSSNLTISSADIIISDSWINNSNYNDIFISFTNIFSSEVYDSNIDTYWWFNNSLIYDSNISNSNLVGTNVSSSDINNSILTNCNVTRAIVKNYMGSNCIIIDSIVDPPTPGNDLTGSNVTGSSNITSSNVTFSNVESSNITDSNIDTCDIEGSELTTCNASRCYIKNTSLSNATIIDANISDGVIYSGSINSSGFFYNASLNGSANLSEVINMPPTASFSASTTSTTPNTRIYFNASSSSDPNVGGLLGDSLTYSWSFGDGSSTASGVTTNHTYNSTGSYQVVLNVTDSYGLKDSASRTIVISIPGGGGSGGGGGGGSLSGCDESWTCTEWSVCESDGYKRRICTDINDCGTSNNRPDIRLSCDYRPPVMEGKQPDKEMPGEVVAPGTGAEQRQRRLAPGEEGEVIFEEDIIAPKKPLNLLILLLILAVIAGALTGAGAIIRNRYMHREETAKKSHVQNLKEIMLEQIKGGKNERKVVREFLEKGWPAGLVTKAVNEINIDMIIKIIKANQKSGHSLKEIADELKKKGWPQSIIRTAIMRIKK